MTLHPAVLVLQELNTLSVCYQAPAATFVEKQVRGVATRAAKRATEVYIVVYFQQLCLSLVGCESFSVS